MSLSNGPRRLAGSGISRDQNHHSFNPLIPPGLALRPLAPSVCYLCHLSLQKRHVSFLDRIFRRGTSKEKKAGSILDPSSPEFLKRRPPPPPTPQAPPKPGELAPGSILEDEDEGVPGAGKRTVTIGGYQRDPTAMAAVLDPIPQARRRWERKMVIRSIKKRGRLSKTERIMQTERQSLAKSAFIKTSIKKLFPLANQIAGKPIEEAIVQMRFSKKKAAQDVKKHLEYARDEAIVKRGMGLGQVPQGVEGAGHNGEGAEKEKEQVRHRIVEDKHGKRRVVVDPTQMYVDQAWVGRGSFSKSPSPRARGKTDLLMHPTTSKFSLVFTSSRRQNTVLGALLIKGTGITVLLKEEATRIRLEEEREQKRKNKKVWIPLPDRPVTAQRQYPLW